MSKLYEAQERAVLTEYHDVLLKLVDKAAQKQREAQQQAQARPSRDPQASSASRPLSAPAHLPDQPSQQQQQQQLVHGTSSSGLALCSVASWSSPSDVPETMAYCCSASEQPHVPPRLPENPKQQQHHQHHHQQQHHNQQQ